MLPDNDNILDNLKFSDKPGFRLIVDLKKFYKKMEIKEDNWKSFLNDGVIDRMNFIENTFNSPDELTLDEAVKLPEKLADIFASYDAFVNAYNLKSENLSENKTKVLKELGYYMRCWISKYHSMILPQETSSLTKGSLTDSPKIPTQNLFEKFED